VRSHQEQHGHQHTNVLLIEAEGGERHDGDLRHLDDDDQPRLLKLVGKAPRGRREQEEGQDEDARGDGRPELAIDARLGSDAEGHQDDQRVLEDVVVQRAHELGDEQRQEAPGLQDCQIAVAHWLKP